MAENGTDVILDEISGDEIQSVLDTLMGNSSISFMDYVASIIQGKVPFDPTDMGRQLIQSVFGNIGQQKSMLLYVLLLAVIGAVIANFSKLMQGKQVATTAFYGVYLFVINRCIYSGINACSADVIRIVRVYQGTDTGVFHQYEFCQWSRSGGGIL